MLKFTPFSSSVRWIALAFFAAATWARAAEDPVKVSLVHPEITLAPGTSTTVRLNLEIAAPFHVYSTITQLGSRGVGPGATTINLKSEEGVTIDGALHPSPAKKHYDPNFELDVLTLEDHAWIDLSLQVAASVAPGTHEAAFIVGYQACNEENCLAPAEITVPFKLVVGAARASSAAAADPRWREAEELAAPTTSRPSEVTGTPAERELARDGRMRHLADLAWTLYQTYPEDPRRWAAFETIFRGTVHFTQGFKPDYENNPTPANLVIDAKAMDAWQTRAAQVESDAATATDVPVSLRELLAARIVSTLVLPYTNTRLPPDWQERLLPPIEKLAAQFPDGTAAFVYFSRVVTAAEAQVPAAMPALIARMSSSPNARIREFGEQRQRVLLATAHPLELKFTALDGRLVDTTQWHGKVVLVDFWATWCVPCIESIPHLKELYGRYHAQGLEIVNISVDSANARPALEKLVAKLGMPWPQYYDGQAFKTEYAVRYGVQPIPHLLLAGPDGMILAVNPTADKLESEIKRLLKL